MSEVKPKKIEIKIDASVRGDNSIKVKYNIESDGDNKPFLYVGILHQVISDIFERIGLEGR